jgi:hypothetical protein
VYNNSSPRPQSGQLRWQAWMADAQAAVKTFC